VLREVRNTLEWKRKGTGFERKRNIKFTPKIIVVLEYLIIQKGKGDL
jgi:hypothetical protein